MKAQTRFSKQVIHRRETTEDKAGEVSRRRFVTSALATAAFAALRTLILADQQPMKRRRLEVLETTKNKERGQSDDCKLFRQSFDQWSIGSKCYD